MSTTFDRVEWSFISKVLEGFGFAQQYIEMIIMSCVQSPTFSILLNGTPKGKFSSQRGLRQGCPLSPFLFIICREILLS